MRRVNILAGFVNFAGLNGEKIQGSVYRFSTII
jgi:hypothetical protein